MVRLLRGLEHLKIESEPFDVSFNFGARNLEVRTLRIMKDFYTTYAVCQTQIVEPNGSHD